MNTDTPELENCDIKALLEIARNLTRERDAALKRLNSSQRARKSLAEAWYYLQAKQDATDKLARELRDALTEMVDANGGVAVMPTKEARKQNSALKSAKEALTKANQLLP